MNKAILIGNLTKDPELTTTPSGVSVCRFGLAVSRDYPNADGSRETDFFNVVVWRNTAENCGKFLKKGNKVAIVGSIQNRQYTADDGTKRTVTEIQADKVEFLTPKEATSPSQGGEEVVTVSRKRERLPLEELDDNQLPF